jgi:RNA polymerase sigma factor (TIGR02999 family)
MSKSERPVRLSELSETMYQNMKAIGGGMMKHEQTGHTLSPTDLVGAAVERLLRNGQGAFNNRAHLLAAAAVAMRRILVEHARAKRGPKRGGGRSRVSWENVVQAVSTSEDPALVLSLDEAITRLGEENERYGRLVEMRVFADLRNPEIAEVLGVSLGTVEKDWRYLRPKLLDMLGEDGASGPG